MKSKHRPKDWLSRGSTWDTPQGKRLWRMDAVCLKNRIYIQRRKGRHGIPAVTKRVRSSIYGYQISFQGKGMVDDFGPPKRLKFKEWDGDGWVGLDELQVLKPWGKSNLPDWGIHWDRGWRDPKCLGDYAYWTAEVLSSRWWTDRAGVLSHAVLVPNGFRAWGTVITPMNEAKNTWGGYYDMGTDWMKFALSRGVGVMSLSRDECNAWDMGLKFFTQLRGKAGVPSLGALVAFVSRFWGRPLGLALESEIKKHAHLSARWAWEGHR